MAKSKKDFTLLLIALFCSSLAHAQKQVPAERKDSIDNGSNIIKIVGNHSNKGAANNALDVLSGQAAGVNVNPTVLIAWLCSIVCEYVVQPPSSVAMTL